MKVVKDSPSRKGFQSVIHGLGKDGKKFSITVHTNRAGYIAPATIARVKKQFGVDLLVRLPAAGMEVPKPKPAPPVIIMSEGLTEHDLGKLGELLDKLLVS